jgi:exodeoxyribonuclease VII large subunit
MAPDSRLRIKRKSLMAQTASPTNATEITVSELSSALKRTLEDRFGLVRVRGEISGYRGPHSSGHAYFSLKDEGARLDAVVWRTTFARLKFKPEEGLEVIATGKITTFAGKSAYQIVVEQLEPAGVGALMALLEARRVKLAAEGLFDAARKRPLPFLPRVIGIVTSPTGAVIRDMLHRLADRFPTRVILWPARVQGEGAAEEIAAGIVGLNALEEGGAIPRPDLIVVARGGGSLEDLWCFNEEIVVRAAAASAVPLISAVGHETDWTLIDHAADLRAPTPTAAAELGVPVRAELVARVAQAGARGLAALVRLARERRAQFRAAARALPAPKTFVSQVGQRLDALGDRMRAAREARLAAGRLALARIAGRLERHSPLLRVARLGERARSLSGRLDAARKAWIGTERARLDKALAELRPAWRHARERRADGFAVLARRWTLRLAEAEAGRLRRAAEVERVGARLGQAARRLLQARKVEAGNVGQVFAAVNYRAVLARGYALALDARGGLLTGAEAAKAAQDFTLRFGDGDLAVSSGGAKPAPRKSSRKARESEPSLF